MSRIEFRWHPFFMLPLALLLLGVTQLLGDAMTSGTYTASGANPQYACSVATSTCEMDSTTNPATASSTVADFTFKSPAGLKLSGTGQSKFVSGDGGTVLMVTQHGSLNFVDGNVMSVTGSGTGLSGFAFNNLINSTQSFVSSIGSGSSAYSMGTGARFQVGAGVGDYFSGNGAGTITFNPSVNVSGNTNIAGAVDVTQTSALHGAVACSSALNKGTITIGGGGTGTATVASGAICTCVETSTALPVAGLKCAVSGTTLTATSTAADVIAYLCF